MQSIVNVTAVTDKDNVAKALVHFYSYHKKVLPVIKKLITQEVQISKGKN